jgi:phosphoenolpyruvate carboxylase
LVQTRRIPGDLDFVRETYIHFDEDMRDSMRFLNPESLSLLPSNLQEPLKMLEIEYDVDERHNEISSHILRNIQIEVVHWNRVGGVAGSTP